MKVKASIIAVSVAALFSAAVSAQSLESIERRDLNQQMRIEQGLKSGQLTVQEAARLESETARVNRLESRALRDGNLSAAERERITRAQDRVSRDIASESHDAQVGNPNSRSSLRMQEEVRRNIRQDQRIERGIHSGQLSEREVGRLDRGMAQSGRMQGRAGADGHIGRYEERGVRYAQNHESRDIRNQRHDDNGRHDGWRNGQHNGQYSGQHGGWTPGAPRPATVGATTAPTDNHAHGGTRAWAHGATVPATSGAPAAYAGRGNYTPRAAQAGAPRLVASNVQQASLGASQRGGAARHR